MKPIEQLDKPRVRILTVDPGICGTGFCLFPAIEANAGKRFVMPSVWGVINHMTKAPEWSARASSITGQFEVIVKKLLVYQVVIELPGFWGSSAKSNASAASGDIFKLTYLVGQLGLVAQNLTGRLPVLMSPFEWKGQLPKDVVIKRIKKLCPNCHGIGNHEADAVGMGLSLQGVLST